MLTSVVQGLLLGAVCPLLALGSVGTGGHLSLRSNC